jgi:hypothetical protein
MRWTKVSKHNKPEVRTVYACAGCFPEPHVANALVEGGKPAGRESLGDVERVVEHRCR